MNVAWRQSLNELLKEIILQEEKFDINIMKNETIPQYMNTYHMDSRVQQYKNHRKRPLCNEIIMYLLKECKNIMTNKYCTIIVNHFGQVLLCFIKSQNVCFTFLMSSFCCIYLCD